MDIKNKIVQDLQDAIRKGDILRRDTLRMILSMINNYEIEKGKKTEGLFQDEIIQVLNRAVKQRKESADQYEKGGRKDLAEKERKEIEIISAYLPAHLSEDEIRKVVKGIIGEMRATSKSQIGQVMGAVMKQLKGQADGSVARKIAEEELKKIAGED